MYRVQWHVPALLAGMFAASLQYAGALKSTPLGDVMPVDLTLLSAMCVLVLLPFLLRHVAEWQCSLPVLVSLVCFAALLGWSVLAGAWSVADEGVSEKLPEMLLFGPVALLIGFCVGGHVQALAGFCIATLLIALGVGTSIAVGLADGSVVLGGAADTELLRVQYQISGLALASAAGLAMVQALRVRGVVCAFWCAVALGCALAALLPGGRAALLALLLTVMIAPGLFLWRAGRAGAASLWILAGAACAAGFALVLLLDPDLSDGLRTLERLNGSDLGEESLRLPLWRTALDWAGAAGPFGLGTGAFPIAAGYGDWRGRHPHNHLIEALVELGLPGFLLLACVWGCAMLAALRAWRGLTSTRIGVVTALVLPVMLSIMVSTDLGNRMAWLGLGLLLSLGAEARA